MNIFKYLFKGYTVQEETYDLSFGGIEVILKSPEKIYSSKLWYDISSPLQVYELYVNGEKIPGRFSEPREKQWGTYNYDESKSIGKESILRYLATGKLWPDSYNELRVYRYGDDHEVILKRSAPKITKPSGKIRSVAQLVRESDGFLTPLDPQPETYDLYIDGKKVPDEFYVVYPEFPDSEIYTYVSGNKRLLTTKEIKRLAENLGGKNRSIKEA